MADLNLDQAIRDRAAEMMRGEMSELDRCAIDVRNYETVSWSPVDADRQIHMVPEEMWAYDYTDQVKAWVASLTA